MAPQRLLFRQEAIDFQQYNRQWGDVGSLQPVPVKIAAWFLAASAAAVTIFLFLAQYSRKETVSGYLTPTSGTAKIFAPQRGTVKVVHVDQGSTVQKGQPLLTIETDQITADGIDVNASMLNILQPQKALLAENIRGEVQRTGSERERLTALVSGLEGEISLLQSQIQLQAERVTVAQSDSEAAEKLRSSGYITAVELRRRQAQVLEQRQAVSALNQQLAARRNQLTETNFALQQLPALMAQKVQALRNDLATTDQRMAEINGRRAYVIRAPTAGRISTLQATVGQNVDPQRLQLEIIPEHAVLQAELFVPARAIGFVEAGQAVRILYDAFPYQHFGVYTGRVVKISQTLLRASDAAGPVALQEPAYRITAALDRAEIEANGKKIALQPDMLLKADIILEKRSLITWLTSPLRGVRM
jgi:membrane fusion protein